jgi:hypothetical protein
MQCVAINSRDLPYEVREMSPASLVVHRPLHAPPFDSVLWCHELRTHVLAQKTSDIACFLLSFVWSISLAAQMQLQPSVLRAQMNLQAHFELQVDEMVVMLIEVHVLWTISPP